MKIGWAFEPGNIENRQLKAMGNLIAKLSGKRDAPELLHVESDIYPGMVLPYGAVLPYTEKRDVAHDIDVKLKKAGLTVSPERIHIYDLPVFSVTNSVDETLRMARQRRCDTIALFTSARKGVERYLVGSFAETMIHRSQTNLLLMNPKTSWKGNLKRVLFLDDFSPESRGDLRETVALCRALKAELVVFHYPHLSYEWELQGENPIVERYRHEVDRRKAAVEQLCRRAGVKAQVIVAGGMTTVAGAAFKLAKKHGTDLIVVAAKMGSFGALLGGSITRQIVRASPVPVLVLKKPRAPKKNKKKMGGVVKRNRRFTADQQSLRAEPRH